MSNLIEGLGLLAVVGVVIYFFTGRKKSDKEVELIVKDKLLKEEQDEGLQEIENLENKLKDLEKIVNKLKNPKDVEDYWNKK
jgi:hypothetical protein